MIDLLKFFIKDKERFENNIKRSNEFDLRACFNLKTGEILDKETAHYNNMFIKLTKHRASVKGSIHKYHNITEGYGNQNYNDFSYCDFQFALNKLQNKFSLDSSDTNITNLEFGLNIEVSEDPKNLVDNRILMYDFMQPNRNEKFHGKGDYLEFKKTDYSLKVYNKSKQNELKDKNILRFELKITGSRYLKKHFEIYTLNDLDEQRFKMLFKKLLECFEKLLIVDDLSIENHQRIDEIILFQNGISTSYWKNLKNTKSYKVRRKFKNDFNKLLKNYNLLNTKNELKQLLESKFIELINCDYKLFKSVA